MGDGFTGINISEAGKVLDDFWDKKETITQKLGEAAREFEAEIVHNWASPKAKEFAKNFSYKLVDVNIIPYKQLNEVYNAAYYAASDMAKANGAEFTAANGPYMFTYTMFYGSGMLNDVVEVSPNGETGMNVQAVTAALEEFTNKVNAQLGAFRDLPREIALYDPSGELKATYQTRLTNAVESVNEIVKSITTEINSNIGTEQDTVITGVQTAIEAMYGD